jgi:hypothetical protein
MFHDMAITNDFFFVIHMIAFGHCPAAPPSRSKARPPASETAQKKLLL